MPTALLADPDEALRRMLAVWQELTDEDRLALADRAEKLAE